METMYLVTDSGEARFDREVCTTWVEAEARAIELVRAGRGRQLVFVLVASFRGGELPVIREEVT